MNRPPASFPAEEYATRINNLRRHLVKSGICGAVISSHISRLYLTGFESSAGTLLIDAEEGAIFIVDFRYILMAKRALPYAKCVLQKSGAPSALTKYTKKWSTVGIENKESAITIDFIKTKIGQDKSYSPIDKILTTLRSIKSKAEILKLKEAIAANDALYSWVLPQIEPGKTEWEIRNLFRQGADTFGHGEAFDTIVCSGKNGAECHHSPDLTPIKRNCPILMDFGVKLDYYHSDMTRCTTIGKATELYKDIYKIVLEANLKAIDAIKPGMTGKEADAIARKHIAKHGYGDAFAHSLGHSVGLEIHEAPNFSPNEETVIKPGMIITVEPGIYLPGKLGIRIEDIVLITRSGCKVLTAAAK